MVKYKGYHHKDVVWMKLVHLDHLLENGKQVSARKGHELARVKKIWKEKKPLASGLNIDEDINL